MPIAFTSTPEVSGPHSRGREIDHRYPFHVIHPENGAIIAYCDSQEEAETVIADYARLMQRMKRESEAHYSRDINVDAVFASLAQGVVNIDSGLTTIEAGSRVHRAMSLLCALRTDGIL